MKVLFVGIQFDRELEATYLSNSKSGLSAAANEFQWNVCDGLIDCVDDDMEILSALPVGVYPRHYKKFLLNSRDWTYRGIQVTEIGSINLPIFKQYQREQACHKRIKKWIEDTPNEQHLIILYSLYTPYLRAISRVIKENESVRAVMIVTDLPGEYGLLPQNKVSAYFALKTGKEAMNLAKGLHGFVLLTEDMKYPLKIGTKPYVVVEGITKPLTSNYGIKYNHTSPKYILYTGTLNKAYGIMHLLDAFSLIKDSEVELWICGTGEAESDIKEHSQTNSRIKYLGFQMKEAVLNLQANAMVLINPRTTAGEYTKYSFPSKTIEYLASGVPVVMHKLPGIPAEYDDYIVFAEDDSDAALARALNGVICWDNGTRTAFGDRGKKFVECSKNPIAQAQKIFALGEKCMGIPDQSKS